MSESMVLQLIKVIIKTKFEGNMISTLIKFENQP